MLSITDISLAHGITPILNSVSFTLNPAERVGLVGANGVGKSTLLKLIVGHLTPDAGSIKLAADTDIGYLPQELPADANTTIQSYLDAATARLNALAAQMRHLEQQMAANPTDLDAVFEAYNTATAAFERGGGYELSARIAQVMSGLSVAGFDRQRTLASLSGGERARVGLAALLIRSPGLLLLDEPTNHLDRAALEWLENFLMAYRGSLLVVSHDRVFLNRAVTRIIELEQHTRRAVSYPGNYEDYAVEKARRRAQWQQDYAAQQAERKRLQNLLKQQQNTPLKRNIKTSDGDKFIKHFKDQTADKTQARNVNALQEQLHRLEADRLPTPPKDLHINPSLDADALHTRIPIELRNITKSYGDTPILHNLSLSVAADEKLSVTGPNGSGKSTLLKIILGLVQPDAGSVSLSAAVKPGYLPQIDRLFTAGTLIDVYGADLPGTYEDHKADLISSGLFTYPELSTPVSAASNGQRRKLQLARLIATQPNILLLDEPTNHLSLDVLEAFERALHAFPGAVIAISHDRRFLQHFSQRQLILRGGQLQTIG